MDFRLTRALCIADIGARSNVTELERSEQDIRVTPVKSIRHIGCLLAKF